MKFKKTSLMYLVSNRNNILLNTCRRVLYAVFNIFHWNLSSLVRVPCNCSSDRNLNYSLWKIAKTTRLAIVKKKLPSYLLLLQRKRKLRNIHWYCNQDTFEFCGVIALCSIIIITVFVYFRKKWNCQKFVWK